MKDIHSISLLLHSAFVQTSSELFYIKDQVLSSTIPQFYSYQDMVGGSCLAINHSFHVHFQQCFLLKKDIITLLPLTPQHQNAHSP